ncbi:MAG: hypothetical protein HYR85_16600, partial [Planctomycetes bacterium]|nr:hypothetical protein [Planctomycetota bacterium]
MTQDLRYRDLPDAVRNLRVEQLGQLLRQVDVAAPTHKNDRVDAVMKQLEGERLRALWARLGPLEKTAVAETVHSADRAFDVDRFVAKHGRAPAALVRDDDRSRDSMSLLNFFFYGNVMPLELMNRLLEFVPKPDPATLATVDEIPTSFEKPRSLWDPETKQRGKSTEKAPVVVRETERAALREVQAVLRLVDAGKIAVGDATKRPTASAMKAVSAVLEGGDFYDDARDAAVGPIKAFAWPMLVQQAGLAKSSGGRLALTRAGLQALSAEPAEVIRSIWARWISSKLLDELSRVDTIKGQTGKGKRGLTDPVDRRIAIENGLRECPAHRWIAVDEFFRYLRAADNDFEVTRDPWRLYFSEPRYDSLGYAGFHDWKILQARYALCFLFEYAATLGLLDVAYVTPDRARHDYGSLGGADEFVFLSRYDGLRYIRLTALSASCWGDETYAAPPREARSVLRVLPNLEIVASGV